MAASWPSDLPQKSLVDGFGEGVGDGLLEYQPDTGPSITRLRSSGAPEPMTLAFEMTSAQIASFKTFFKTTLIGGSLPFTFADPLSGDTVLLKFRKDGLPHWSALGGDNYNFSATVWKMP
jgi:hypothetical protein